MRFLKLHDKIDCNETNRPSEIFVLESYVYKHHRQTVN